MKIETDVIFVLSCNENGKAIALVIFGGWHSFKAAASAYLFAFLQLMGIYFQGWLPTIPAQVFQVALFPLMIFTLLIMSMAQNESEAAFD